MRDKKRVKERAEVMLAWSNGETIQFLTGSGVWADTFNPTWIPFYEYRVKPKKVVRYINLYPNGFSANYNSRSDADRCCYEQRISCVRVEIEPGRFDE